MCASQQIQSIISLYSVSLSILMNQYRAHSGAGGIQVQGYYGWSAWPAKEVLFTINSYQSPTETGLWMRW